MLLGDAGTATLLEKTDDRCDVMTFGGATYGEGFRSVYNCYGGFRHHAAKGAERMDDIEVFNFILTYAPQAIREFWTHTGTGLEDYDCYALHQASLFTLKQLSRKLKIGMDKIPLSLARYGNTGPASIPVTLVHAFGEHAEKKQMRTLMCGFGVGLSVSAASAMLDTADILPMVETEEYFDDGILEGATG